MHLYRSLSGPDYICRAGLSEFFRRLVKQVSRFESFLLKILSLKTLIQVPWDFWIRKFVFHKNFTMKRTINCTQNRYKIWQIIFAWQISIWSFIIVSFRWDTLISLCEDTLILSTVFIVTKMGLPILRFLTQIARLIWMLQKS